MAQITDIQARRQRIQRIQIALVGLLCVGFAVFVTGALLNPGGVSLITGQDAAAAAQNTVTGKDDPLAEIGAAPVAEQDETISGTGATVNQVTGNVSDIPAQRR